MASFTIVENGLVTEPYASNYGFQSVQGQNTIRNINGNKIGMVVTLSSQGKPDLTHYCEVENIKTEGLQEGFHQSGFPDEETRNHWLQRLADQYEAS